MIDLQPGAIGRLLVTFRAAREGQLCQDVTVTADGGVTATARNCLTASAGAADQAPATLPPSTAASPSAAGAGLTVHVSGPQRQQIGDVASFKIEVTNATSQNLDDVQIVNHFDASLQPKQATEEYAWLPGNDIGWKNVSLPAGQTIKRQIDFVCLRQTPRACNRVTVTATGTEQATDQTCLEVAAAAGAAAPGVQQPPTINVAVADTADPIKIQGETTYQILVSNAGAQSAFDVVVTATYGDELKLAGMSAPVDGGVLANSVRFAPIRELRAGESPLSFELRFTGVRAGTARFQVDVSSRGLAAPATAEQSTEILP
jgi:hypothetical protein